MRVGYKLTLTDKFKGGILTKQVEIRIWNKEDKDLVEVYVDNEFWFDIWTNDFFSVTNFVLENMECEMKIKFMN